MPKRARSPALSENGLDISNALTADAASPDLDDERAPSPSKRSGNADQAFTNAGLGDGSDDEDFIAIAQAASNRKSSNVKGRSVKKGGGFQAMGLNANLLKAITRKGFSVPTPIQRRTMPLLLDGQDVVGMARTGSGKTAAFVIPMIEKLKSHSAKVGSRALIMSPSRELALQTLKVVKELSRGTDLKCILLVGGDRLEDQFGFMAGNPDIIIATPGRFLHLQVEMQLDLSSMRYVVFDEADRLFEMGFAAQLSEILHALPQNRQTLLFSATLPKSLVEFAKAGLQEPSLVRLDGESKISPDLQMAFFSVKSDDKEGSLLHLVQDVIKIPTGNPDTTLHARHDTAQDSKKRKRNVLQGPRSNESPTEYSTLIFASTKYHVDHITSLLRIAGYVVSYVYGSLDQTARRIQVEDFRSGITRILVVTDVAARGIDIPILANVINYDFPPQPKIFVHRVGRTARAGQRGWSYSLVGEPDIPYLLDLQLFLGKELRLGRGGGKGPNYAEDIVIGSMTREKVAACSEWVAKLLEEDSDLAGYRSVASRAEKQYLRTRSSASIESARRAKEIGSSKGWMELHPLFGDSTDTAAIEQEDMLARVSGFRPQETVFEIGKRGSQGEASEVVKKRRLTILAKKRKDEELGQRTSTMQDVASESQPDGSPDISKMDHENESIPDDDPSSSGDDLEVILSETHKPNKFTRTIRDSTNYMSYTPTGHNPHEERGYGVHSSSQRPGRHNPSSFLTDARAATLDLGPDEAAHAFGDPTRAGLRWDKRSKKYVSRANDADGNKDGSRMIRSESGRLIAASFRSGRFDAWRKTNRIAKLPRVGEMEKDGRGGVGGDRMGMQGRRWRHRAEKAPKEVDKFRDDYFKRKKKVEAAKEKGMGRFRDQGAKSEIKGAGEVRKERMAKEKRRDKTARPSRKKK